MTKGADSSVTTGSASSEEGTAATSSSTVASPASAATTASSSVTVADGLYNIRSGVSQAKCLDVAAGSVEDGAVVQTWDDNTTAAQRWQLMSAGSGYYTVKSVASGKYLDVAGGIAANGSRVQQYAGNGTAAQLWKIVYDESTGLYSFVSKLSPSYVLDVAGGSTANGAHAQLYSSNGTLAQRWQLELIEQLISNGCYTLWNEGSGKVLDVDAGSIESGANVQQYSTNGTMAQTYYIGYDGGTGYYRILNVGSCKSVDVSGASASNGANVWQYASNSTAAQRWSASRNSDGSYTFLSAISGLALDVAAGSTADGANVRVWASNATKAQRWALSSVASWLSDGVYQIVTANNQANVLGVGGSSTSSGAAVSTLSRDAAFSDQKWAFSSMGSGYYKVVNLNSGKVLDVAGGSAANGTTVQQYAENDTNAQLWKPVITATGIKLVSRLSGSVVLDILGNLTSAGTKADVYQSNDTIAQRFVLAAVDVVDGGAFYRWSSVANDGLVLDVAGASTSDGAAVQLYASNGTRAQVFRAVKVSGDSYRLVNVNSGKCLAVAGGSSLQQQAIGSSTSQLWRIAFDASTNGLTLTSASTGKRLANSNSALVLAVAGSSAAQSFLAHTVGLGSGSTMDGIDIASYEGGIDLASVPSDFVIVKATQGTGYVNPYYSGWASEVLNLGKELGIYHYADGSGAVAEADHFVSLVRSAGAVGKALLVLDWEEDSAMARGVSYALSFLNRVYALTGVRALVYTSQRVTNDYDWSSVANAGYGLWVAQYLNANTNDQTATDGYLDDPVSYRSISGWSSATMYQYSSVGNLPGWSGHLDLDKFYGSRSDWESLARAS
ncbi:MAG: RICIN domain-containing protein [Atopobiaceae bacterium]